MTNLEPSTLVLKARFHTSNPFHDVLISSGFSHDSTSVLDYAHGLPEFVRYRSPDSEASATVVFDYVVDLWFSVVSVDPRLHDQIASELELMTRVEAFERTSKAVTHGDDDVDIQVALIAALAPSELDEKWSELFMYYLEHDNDFYRHHGVRVLRWMMVGRPAVWSNLWDTAQMIATDDDSQHVRHAARETLQWRAPLAADPLLKNLVPSEWHVPTDSSVG
jgi:hypothetical protein